MSLLSRPVAPAVLVLAAAVAPALVALGSVPAASAAADKTKTRPDSVTIQAGGPKVTVHVLANDKIAGNRKKARISFVDGSYVPQTSGTVHSKPQTIVFSAPVSSPPTTASMLYEVTDSLGHTSTGTITLTITAAAPRR